MKTLLSALYLSLALFLAFTLFRHLLITEEEMSALYIARPKMNPAFWQLELIDHLAHIPLCL